MKKYVGYRVMLYDKSTNRAISGADSRCSIELKKGRTIRYGESHFVTLDKEYAKSYYAVHEHNVILEVEFYFHDIISGSIDDKETEIAIKRSELIDWEILD